MLINEFNLPQLEVALNRILKYQPKGPHVAFLCGDLNMRDREEVLVRKRIDDTEITKSKRLIINKAFTSYTYRSHCF